MSLFRTEDVEQLFAELSDKRWDEQLLTWWVRHREAHERASKSRPKQEDRCRNGHAWTEGNTHRRRNGTRECRACHRERALESYHRQRQRHRGVTNG